MGALRKIMASSLDLQRAFQRMGYKLNDNELTGRCLDLSKTLALSANDMASAYMTWAVQK